MSHTVRRDVQTEPTQQHSTANMLPHLTVKWKFMGTQLPGVTSVLACRRAVEREASSNSQLGAAQPAKCVGSRLPITARKPTTHCPSSE